MIYQVVSILSTKFLKVFKRFKSSMLRSDLYDYSDACIAVKETIDLLATAANENDKAQKNVAFKNNAPFRSCISKINITLIDNAKDLYIIMSMYNLLEYNQSYSMTSRSLWNYYRNETDNVDNNASDTKLFNYITKIVGKTPERPPQLPQPDPDQDGNQPSQPEQPPIPALNFEVTIPLRSLSNFWRFLDLPL